jgi:thiol-disulfide isomerase/thioredoxin
VTKIFLSKYRSGVIAVVALLLAPALASGFGGRGESRRGSERPALPAARDFDIQVYQNGQPLGGLETSSFATVLDQGKPVVLNFWAGLCGPCRAEMPELQATYDALKDDIVLLGIDIGPFTGLGTVEQGVALLQQLGVRFPAGTTSSAAVVTDYGILGMPTTFFITSAGGVARKWTGPLNEDKLTELVNELLALEDA